MSLVKNVIDHAYNAWTINLNAPNATFFPIQFYQTMNVNALKIHLKILFISAKVVNLNANHAKTPILVHNVLILIILIDLILLIKMALALVWKDSLKWVNHNVRGVIIHVNNAKCPCKSSYFNVGK